MKYHDEQLSRPVFDLNALQFKRKHAETVTLISRGWQLLQKLFGVSAAHFPQCNFALPIIHFARCGQQDSNLRLAD